MVCMNCQLSSPSNHNILRCSFNCIHTFYHFVSLSLQFFIDTGLWWSTRASLYSTSRWLRSQVVGGFLLVSYASMKSDYALAYPIIRVKDIPEQPENISISSQIYFWKILYSHQWQPGVHPQSFLLAWSRNLLQLIITSVEFLCVISHFLSIYRFLDLLWWLISWTYAFSAQHLSWRLYLPLRVHCDQAASCYCRQWANWLHLLGLSGR